MTASYVTCLTTCDDNVAMRDGGNVVEESQAQLRLYSSRWLVLASLGGLGLLLGFSIVFPGIVDQILTEHFQLDIGIVDWFTLCNAAAQIVFMAPVGIYAIANPLKVKLWLLIAFLLLILAFAAVCTAVIAKELFWMTFVGMVLVGIADTIFRALVPLIAVSWFSDSTQGHVCGVSYAFLGSGSSVAAIATAIFLTVKTQQNGIANAIFAITIIEISGCVIAAVSLLLTWKFVPENPPSPPSLSAANRWVRYSRMNNRITIHQAAKEFLYEAKVLLTDTTSAILVISYGIILATMVVHNMMLPTIPDGQDESTGVSASKQKSYLLICFSVCSAIGSIISGASIDRIKSYKPIVIVIGLCSIFCSVIMLVGYYLQLEIILYLSIGLYGLSFLSLLPFQVDILKQHSHLKVNEVTQSVFFVIMWNVFVIILSEIFRSVISLYGGIAFYISNVVVCTIAVIILLPINPHLKRFNNVAVD